MTKMCTNEKHAIKHNQSLFLFSAQHFMCNWYFLFPSSAVSQILLASIASPGFIYFSLLSIEFHHDLFDNIMLILYHTDSIRTCQKYRIHYLPLKMCQSLALLCVNIHKQLSQHAPTCEAVLQLYMPKTKMLLRCSVVEKDKQKQQE